MNKKLGRPISNNVPYFPHYTETSNELMFLERKHGAEGYRAYYRLFEMIAKAEHHHIIIKTENQKLTFMYTMNVDKNILDDVIEYLVEIDFIDQELYKDKQIIWIPRFIEKFREVYRNRGRSLPYKQGNTIIVSATETHSKEKKSKVSKEKRESIQGSLTKEVLNELQAKHPNVEVNDSYDRFVNHHKSKGTYFADVKAGFENWLKGDEKYGNHPRKKENKETIFYCVNVDCKCFGKTKKVKSERDISHPHCDDCEHQMGREYEYKLALIRIDKEKKEYDYEKNK